MRPMRQENRRVRRGASLVEIMVVVSLVTMVLSGVATTMHVVLRHDLDAKRWIQRSQSRQRFASQFRWEAHRALDAQVGVESAGPDGIVFRRASGEDALFRAEPKRIVYEVRAGSERRSIDSFPLSGQERIRFRVSESGKLASVEWSDDGGAASQPASLLPLRIDGAVGLLRGTEERQP